MSIKDALTYRIEMLLWSLINAAPLLAGLVLWLSAYGERSEIAGYSQIALISYYIFGYLFQNITGAHFEDDILADIRNGTVSGKLTKPLSIKISFVIRETGWRLMTILTSVLPIMIFSYIFVNDIFFQINTKYLIVIPLFLTLAYLLENIFSLMIASMGFVFEEATSLTHLKWMLGWLFSGSMMPFEFMPTWLANLSSVLPFKFRYYVPVQIIRGELESPRYYNSAELTNYMVFATSEILGFALETQY